MKLIEGLKQVLIEKGDMSIAVGVKVTIRIRQKVRRIIESWNWMFEVGTVTVFGT